jgi:hypothetical protein
MWSSVLLFFGAWMVLDVAAIVMFNLVALYARRTLSRGRN